MKPAAIAGLTGTVTQEVFRPTPVGRITADAVLAYIAERKKAGMLNGTINRDPDVLRGVLKRANRWYMMAEEVRPLAVSHSVGRALTDDDKVRLLKLAASKPEWQNARLAALLALNTAMRACEIRGLRWRDVDSWNVLSLCAVAPLRLTPGENHSAERWRMGYDSRIAGTGQATV